MTETKTILIVDDDKSVRDSLERVLRLQNFDVLLAVSGKDALREALRAKIDFVFLDLNLGPNDDGWDTFDALQKVAPSLPVLVMTGEAPRMAHSSASRAAALLLKPITDYPYLFRRLRELQKPGQAMEGLAVTTK
jgi:DNA-binding NtrC family response regulator